MFDPLPENLEALKVSPRIKRLVERRLIQAPSEVKRYFPRVFSYPVDSGTYATPKYFMLFLFNHGDEAELDKRNLRFNRLFPYLIAEGEEEAAFGIGGTKNNYFRRTDVRGMHTLRLHEDSTVILVDHTQGFPIHARGIGDEDLVYVVKLAYIMSFGREITFETAHEFLEDMVAYSLTVWTRGDAEKPSR